MLIYMSSVSTLKLKPRNITASKRIGTFLQNITANATFDWSVRDDTLLGGSGTVAFCDVMDSIEQPDPHRQKQCPPEKGFAIMSAHIWDIKWFVGDVSF
jgi:hypothetical protein